MTVQIRIGEKPTHDALASLMAAYRYGRYCENPRFPLEKSRAHELFMLESVLALPETVAVTAWGGPVLEGILAGRLSAWDSEHFGFPMAVLEKLILREKEAARDREEAASRLTAAFLAWCREHRVRFASARLPSRDLSAVQALEDAGFRYIESYIYNVVDLDRLDEGACLDAPLRSARPEDRDAMRRCAPGAFATQRFHADPNFPRDKAEALYLKWIDSAFDDPEREILVMEEDGRPVAFMVYRDGDYRATLGLRSAALNMGLLDPEARGRGVGTRFYRALFQRFRSEGFGMVESGLSLRNQASLNWHNKTGFRIVGTYVTLHRWFDPSAGA